MPALLLAVTLCGCMAEPVDEKAYAAGQTIAKTLVADTDASVGYDDLAPLCQAAHDQLRDLGGSTSNELFSYVLGCKDVLRAHFH